MKQEKYIATLDAGTSSVRTIIVNKEGKIVSSNQLEFTQIFPKAGWVEHNPIEIWNAQRTTFIQALNSNNIMTEQIIGVGVTNQRETIVVWNKNTGLPIYNAIVWQDQRTSGICQKLIGSDKEEIIRKKTGLVIAPYFSATKLQWILDNVKGARELANKGELLCGTIDTWLMWKFSNHQIYATDVTNASRTMLFNIHTLTWDDELLQIFNIPKNILPEVKSSSEVYGIINSNLLDRSSKVEIPITSAIGDQQAALFGQLCTNIGDVKNTYGTGSFILMNVGENPVPSKNGLLTTIALKLNGKVTYALEGSVFVAGAAVQWLRDQLKVIYHSSETEWYANLASKENDQRIYVVPSFTGMGSPYWDSYARGAIFGLERATKREHIVKATLEGIVYQVSDVITAMIDDLKTFGLKEKLNLIKVDGGATNNNYLMQFQSNISRCQVQRPKNIESTAMGATFLAGLAINFWDESQLNSLIEIDKLWESNISLKESNRLIHGWKVAVSRTRNWTKDLEGENT